MCRASQDSWAAHHARLLTRLEQHLDEVDTAEAEAREAAAAASATMAELHAQERRRLQLQHQELEHVVENLEQKVEQLERDGAVKQQQQEELTNMCAQVCSLGARPACTAATSAAVMQHPSLHSRSLTAVVPELRNVGVWLAVCLHVLPLTLAKGLAVLSFFPAILLHVCAAS